MIKKLMNGIVTGLAALTLSGCAVYLKPKIPEDFSVVPEYRVGMDAFYTKATVSRELRTTPVHPSDASFLSGSTTTRNPSGPGGAVKAGVAASVGVPDFRVYVGGDLKYSGLSLIDARKQQSSDPRPPEQGSFVDTRLLQSYTVMPLAGLEATVGKFIFRLEGGMPYSRFDVESGHERYGRFDPVQHERWAGWGKHVRADVLFKTSEKWYAGGSLGYEHFDAEFAGEKSDIDSFFGAVQIGVKF